MSTHPMIHGAAPRCNYCGGAMTLVRQPGGDLTFECTVCHHAAVASPSDLPQTESTLAESTLADTSVADDVRAVQAAAEQDFAQLRAESPQAFRATRVGRLFDDLASECYYGLNMRLVLYALSDTELGVIEAFADRCKLARGAPVTRPMGITRPLDVTLAATAVALQAPIQTKAPVVKAPVITVAEVPDDAQFLSNTQDVAAIKDHLGDDAADFDAFFVIVGDGDYTAIWGMSGTMPLQSKPLYRLK